MSARVCADPHKCHPELRTRTRLSGFSSCTLFPVFKEILDRFRQHSFCHRMVMIVKDKLVS